MPIEFESSPDKIPKKDTAQYEQKVTSAREDETTSVRKTGLKGAVTLEFPHQVGDVVNRLAMEVMKGIKEAYRLAEVAVMAIPDGKAAPSGKRVHTVSKDVGGFFSVISSEALYQKWVETVAKQTEKEIEVEQEEKRITKYRRVLKTCFRKYLDELKEKQRKPPPSA